MNGRRRWLGPLDMGADIGEVQVGQEDPREEKSESGVKLPIFLFFYFFIAIGLL